MLQYYLIYFGYFLLTPPWIFVLLGFNLILTFSSYPSSYFWSIVDTFTVSNMHQSINNTERRYSASESGCRSQHCLMGGGTNINYQYTELCFERRFWEGSAWTLAFCLILVRLVQFISYVPVCFYPGATSAGRHVNSSVPPVCWQMSPPACLTLVIKTSCLLSRPEAKPCWSDCTLWNNSSVPSNFNLQI